MSTSDAGMDPTLTPTEAPTEGARPTDAELPDAGYDLGEVIGRGGMGEVIAADDRRIGRAVAIKRMKLDSAQRGDVARFLREARIQARLDHPAIVPVYELGTDSAGTPYFTMKRLAGTTLLARLADGQQTELLRAFVEVCLAIELAHTRGIVHRDLKPANIMLGDFGEVYVLDWGVARVLAESEDASALGPVSHDGRTLAGSVLGTPGYMAPEQARGEPVGPHADVYSLGCILFEILAREPLHPRDGALTATLAPHDGSPARRKAALAIAPELDAVCTAALAASPTDRPTARALADRIQRYLDGDRDLERRRALAADELIRARGAVATGDRAVAMQASGRALALDPSSRDAASIVTQLMLEPPKLLPPDLIARYAQLDDEYARAQWRPVMYAWLSLFGALPLFLWQGVRDVPYVTTFFALIVVMIGFAYRGARSTHRDTVFGITLNFLLLFMLGRTLGPFVFGPPVLCITVASWVAYPTMIDRPLLPITLGVIAAGAPIALEWLGVLSPTWAIRDHALVSWSALVDISPIPTGTSLVIGTVGSVAVAGLLGRSVAAQRRALQRKVEAQAWQLRQLLPG